MKQRKVGEINRSEWRDITSRNRAEAIQASQNRILKLLATGGGLKKILEEMVTAIEEQASGMLCSVLLFDPQAKCLRHGAAPSLPCDYTEAVDGIRIGPTAGSCGTAAFRAQRVIVEDIEQDPLWVDFRGLALKHDLRACWSQPIISSTGQLLGTFAMYYNQPRGPLETELEVIEQAADLAGIAIERKQSEEALRESEAQLRQSQKMEAVGQLAGGIAHDFNNILTTMMGFGDLLAGRLGPEDPARPYAEEIRKAVDRAALLTGKLLAFSRKQILNPRVLDLNELINDMREILRSIVGERIDLRFNLDPQLKCIMADASQIELIIINLTANARDAMPDGGTLSIDTANVANKAHLPRDTGPALREECACLRVRDTGCGMNAETQAHIFEPFYTTKPRGKGTGLGLASVYGIVMQSGGFVTVSSKPDEGAEFEILFPLVEGRQEESEEHAVSSDSPGGSETVLLVEDERSVRELLSRALREKGYRVLEACHGLEALKLYQAQPGQIDIVVTDLVMPQMGGVELIKRLSGSSRKVKVLYMSGHMEDQMVQQVIAQPGSQFIQKPFRPAILVSRVRETLDSASP